MLRRIQKVRRVGETLVVTIPLGMMDVNEGDRVLIVSINQHEISIIKEELEENEQVADKLKNISEDKRYKHGMCRTSEYKAWATAIQRCTNEKNIEYEGYGGRGIKMCDEWMNSFEKFLEYIGKKPGPQYSLGRIDNDKDYEPGNVRWETQLEQTNNRRTNNLITVNGETKTIAEWSRSSGISQRAIWARIMRMGWKPEDAINTPVNSPKNGVGSKYKFITIDNETYPQLYWCRKYRVSAAVVKYRVEELGWSYERAFKIPVLKRGQYGAKKVFQSGEENLCPPASTNLDG
jgi:hypothetical protein